MKLFTPKENLKNTIPLMALMIALNTIFNVLASYIPIAGYIFILFFPLISTLYCLNTKFRYFPIYFVCSVGFSLISTLGDFSTTFLYLIPSLFEGLIFAICINKKINIHVSFVLGTIVLFFVQILFIPLIDFIYSIDTINSLLKIFGLINITNIQYFIPSIIYIILSIEMLLVCIFVKSEISKFKYQFNNEKTSTFLSIFSLICTLCSIFMLLFNVYKLMILFITINAIIMILLIYELFKNKIKLSFIIVPISLILEWLIFVLFTQNELGLISLISFNLSPLTVSLTILIIKINDKIKMRGL